MSQGGISHALGPQETRATPREKGTKKTSVKAPKKLGGKGKKN